jgi:cyclin-dependent kinase 8/11
MGDGRAGGGSNRPAWLQQYDLVGKIGEGTYGLVFLARVKPPHPAPGRRGPPIAIKKFKQSKEGDGVSPTAIREIMVRVFRLLCLLPLSPPLARYDL